MDPYRPGSLSRRITGVLLLVVGIAVAARVVYDLLAPLLPLAVALLVVSGLYLVTVGHWRR